MALKEKKWPDNSPGPFYVDDQCIACNACTLEAPIFFEMNKTLGYAFVKQQPKNIKQISKCLEALESCPVGAIGNDDLTANGSLKK